MTHIYSLAYLTSTPLAPPDAVVLANKLGYQAIGVRIAPAAPGGDFSPLPTDAAMLRETIRRIDDTGEPQCLLLERSLERGPLYQMDPIAGGQRGGEQLTGHDAGVGAQRRRPAGVDRPQGQGEIPQ